MGRRGSRLGREKGGACCAVPASEVCANEHPCSSLDLHDIECVYVPDSAAERSAPVQKTLITSLFTRNCLSWKFACDAF